MTDLTDLYQEIILDHARRPRHHHAIDDADRQAEGFNPLCGDRVTVFLKTGGDRIEAAGFTGVGCAICTASASLMTDRLAGLSNDEASALFDAFHELLTVEDAPTDDLGELAALAGVRRFPMRVKCATLPWHTMKAALLDDSAKISTE